MLLPGKVKLLVGHRHEVHLGVTARPHPDHVSQLAVPLRNLLLNAALVLPKLHVVTLGRRYWSANVKLCGDPLLERFTGLLVADEVLGQK